MYLSGRRALLDAHSLPPRHVLLCVRSLGVLLGALSQMRASDSLVLTYCSSFLVPIDVAASKSVMDYNFLEVRLLFILVIR